MDTAPVETSPAEEAVALQAEGAESTTTTDDGEVSADWIVREARRTYDAAHEAGSLSTAVSCLNLIGKHLGVAAPEGGEEAGVFIVTGIEGAPGSDADD